MWAVLVLFWNTIKKNATGSFIKRRGTDLMFFAQHFNRLIPLLGSYPESLGAGPR